MSTRDWVTVFENVVKASREAVANIEAMPADQVDEPLAKLRDGLRAALAQYDRDKTFNDLLREKMFE